MKRIAKREKKGLYHFLYRFYILFGIVFFPLLTIGLTHLSRLEQLDRQVSDFIYWGLNYRTKEPDVSIIAIDAETVEQLGSYESWSRSRTAAIIELLDSSGFSPGVIAIGLDYSQTMDSEGDNALIEVCERYDNICLGSYVLTENNKDNPRAPLSTEQKTEDSLSSAPAREDKAPAPVRSILLPFDELLPYVSTGVINNLQTSADGYARSAVTAITHNGKEYDSFALTAYKMYRSAAGEEIRMPRVDAENVFSFSYLSGAMDYPVYSFYDVLTGNVDLSVFDGKIVLIGDYTSSEAVFKAPGIHDSQMQAIEIQANVIESLLSQKTGQAVSYSLSFIFYALFAVIFFVVTSYSSRLRTLLSGVLLIVLQLAACAVLYLFGYYIMVLIPCILVACITMFNLAVKYLAARHSNYQLQHAFKKYVDKSIVNEIVENGRLDVHIGGEVKDIAVLFVDIRGFTSLSENMEPEQVVDILNKYLALAAKAIADNHGTLDKFIGDAAMALFNSPADLKDYEYRAVCAAWELMSSTRELNDFCEKQYGRQVSFGIGIHCGEAVIGNIGCESRMDYTAIGDTVNTASRLEGIALSGQILISAEMKRRLDSRVQTSYAGEFSLKGKKNKVPVYLVTGIQSRPARKALPAPAPAQTAPMAGRLSCIPSPAQLSDYAAFAKEYHAAFEYNDFFLPEILDDEKRKEQLVAQYMSLDRDRSEDTLHGAFLDICVNSADPQIFAVSDLRVHQCMDIARKMGLKAVVFHTNYIVNFRLKSYLSSWLTRNEDYWRRILREYPGQRIYLENMFDDSPELLTALAARMKDEPRFAVCLDVAHAFLSGSPLPGWYSSLAPYVAHLHINDNNQYEDLHRPVGEGSFPWESFSSWAAALNQTPSTLIEVRSFEDLEKSVAYMKLHGIYPFCRSPQ